MEKNRFIHFIVGQVFSFFIRDSANFDVLVHNRGAEARSRGSKLYFAVNG